MKWLQALLLAAAAAAIAFYTLHLGMIQFGGMDGSAALQAAWRYHLGQTPYSDFRSVAPPSYIVPSGLAFDVLGVRWRTLVILAALFSALTFLWQTWLMMRARFGIAWSVAVGLLTQLVTMIQMGWWSYNQTTSVAAVVFIAAALALLRQPDGWPERISMLLSLALLSWMKPNVAGALIAGVTIALLVHRPTRRTYAACAAAATALSISLMFATHVNPLRLIESYLGAKGRMFDSKVFMSCFLWTDSWESIPTLRFLSLAALALVAAAPTLNRRANSAEGKTALAIAALFIVTGFLAMGTNNDLNSDDTPLVVVGVMIVVARREGAGERLVLARAALAACLACLIAWGFILAEHRDRIMAIGSLMFFESAALSPLDSPPLFKGVQVGPRFQSVLLEMDTALKTNPHGSDDVFFGPRMEFGYPAWGLTPAKGLSLWWTGTGEAPRAETEAVSRAFARWHPRLCIFLRDDFTYVPDEVMAYLVSHYDRRDAGSLTICHLRRLP